MFAISLIGPMFVPGATTPGESPLKSFVDQSVSDALIKYFEDKGDPGIQVNSSPNSVLTLRTNCAIHEEKNLRGNAQVWAALVWNLRRLEIVLRLYFSTFYFYLYFF